MEILALLAPIASSDMVVPLLAFLVGLAINIVKMCVTEDVSLKEYIVEHKYRSTLSLTSLVTVFTSIQIAYPDTSWLLYLAAGYCVDSLANKAPLTQKKIDKFPPK